MTITRTELLEIIRNGENSGIEFKRDVIENYDLATAIPGHYFVIKII